MCVCLCTAHGALIGAAQLHKAEAGAHSVESLALYVPQAQISSLWSLLPTTLSCTPQGLGLGLGLGLV